METESKRILDRRVGLYSSLAMTLLTLAAFGFAMTAIPPSGPYSPGDPMLYPYADLLTYYPGDYYWMYITIVQLCVFLVFIMVNHHHAPLSRKIFSYLSTAFAIISVTVLMADYFIQFSVVPISMIKGETEGIALLTQYNGHGIFIALEELGFTMMSLAFLFLSPIFNGKNRLEKTIRGILILPFVVTLSSFIFYTGRYGLDRDYRFEVAAITINWIVTIIIGVLVGIYFQKEIKIISKEPGIKHIL